MLELTSPVQYVKGVGPKKAAALAAAGIHTVHDLLLYLPFRYEDRSRRLRIEDISHDEQATVEAEVVSLHVKQAARRRNLKIIEVVLRDETGRLKAVWFNQEYLKDTLTKGRRVRLYGKFDRSRLDGVVEVKSPQLELVDDPEAESTHTGRIVPVYERIGPMSPTMLRRVAHFLVAGLPPGTPDLLPTSLRERLKLPGREEALSQVHFPEEDAEIDHYNAFRSIAQRRLILEELFLFFVGVELQKSKALDLHKARSFPVDDRIREVVRKMLPFRLTDAQRSVLKEIADELGSGKPMRRLLQGDVGSGKTIVGVLASVIVIEHRAQVAFMVPTEVLAEQHFANVRRLLEPAGYRVALLSARLGKSERETKLGEIEEGKIDLVVGTHALIQEGVRFRELGLAIIDEQHRFGVLQRNVLREKGVGCDLLIMTATPIPRSLTMALYGDLDLSVLDEMPPGRQPIETLQKDASQLEGVFELMRSEIAKGHQVYFVCPLIEESESTDLRAAVARADSLREGVFRDRRVGLVHGRMPAAEREEVMQAFSRGEVDILVATTVIEVGVDVGNATVMVIEHAERFGLAQLHQLRGRVGRGRAPSTAVLVTYPPFTPEAEKRLGAMLATTDGFEIAERDLDIRGAGDMFGTRQSGLPLFRVANLARDREVLGEARKEARAFFRSPEARSPEGENILRHVVKLWSGHFEIGAGG